MVNGRSDLLGAIFVSRTEDEAKAEHSNGRNKRNNNKNGTDNLMPPDAPAGDAEGKGQGRENTATNQTEQEAMNDPIKLSLLLPCCYPTLRLGTPVVGPKDGRLRPPVKRS